MRRVNYDEPIKNLPDAFAKDKDSNNYKFLQIQKRSSDRVLKVLQDISDAFNIDNAYGATLDLWYGGKVSLERGQMSDEQYRIRLKGKQMQNTADGSFPDLVKALAFVLQCGKKDIHIVASETSNAVIVKNLPNATLKNAGFNLPQINDLIMSLLPAGVKIAEYNYNYKIAHNVSFGSAIIKTYRKFVVPAGQLPDIERGYN